MSITLDVNILCNKILNEEMIFDLLNTYEASVESINCIDNWMWDNEQKIEVFNNVKEVLNDNRIVIIQLKMAMFKDLGIYIEKVGNFYLYTLWINTEGYPTLDCDKITAQNSKFYQEIYQIISKINNKTKKIFEVIGIGLETDFQYDENLVYTIQNSRNMIVWIFNSDFNVEVLKGGYDTKKIDGLEMKVLEKTIM